MLILKQLVKHYIAADIGELQTKSEHYASNVITLTNWHLVEKLEPYILKYESLITKYLEEFR